MRDPEVFLERRLFARYADPGDPVDADVLIRRYLPLAHALAATFRTTSEPYDDLLQVATLGLLKAIRRFDPARGIMFSSYATPTIMGELRRHFRDTTWVIHVPRDLKVLGLRVIRARRPVSLEEPRGEAAEQGTLGDTVGADDAGFGRAIERGAIEALLRHTTPREREILRLRFEEDLTQREIARRIGLSQNHVSRILRDVLAQLRDAVSTQRAAPALAAAGERSTAPRT